MLVTFGQSSRLKEVSPFPIVTEVNFCAWLGIPLPVCVTESGISRVSRATAFQNAPSANEVTVSGIVTLDFPQGNAINLVISLLYRTPSREAKFGFPSATLISTRLIGPPSVF